MKVLVGIFDLAWVSMFFSCGSITALHCLKEGLGISPLCVERLVRGEHASTLEPQVYSLLYNWARQFGSSWERREFGRCSAHHISACYDRRAARLRPIWDCACRQRHCRRRCDVRCGRSNSKETPGRNARCSTKKSLTPQGQSALQPCFCCDKKPETFCESTEDPPTHTHFVPS